MIIDVSPSQLGWRLDKVVTQTIEGLGRAGARRLFADGRVRVRGPHGRARRVDKGMRATLGMIIEVEIDDVSGAARPDPDLPLRLALERDDLVIVDKAPNVPSAPLRHDEGGTVANALVARFPDMAKVGFSAREPGLCHRLDTATSGLLMAARTQSTFESISEALRGEAIDKRYLAIVDGTIDEQGEVLLPLASREHRVIACEDPFKAERLAARDARTTWQVIERRAVRTLIEVRAARAFRHQVRVHLAAIGAPLLGDTLYGGSQVEGFERFALHASHLAWRGDAVTEGFDVSSPLPDELRALL